MLSRKQVAESQRRRILDAMVSAVGENGYARTPVAAVIERAGVSRKAFYERFPNKDACFAAAVDEVTGRAVAHLEATVADASGAGRGVERTIEALFASALAHPQAVRLVLAELCALGPEQIARREQLVSVAEGIVSEMLRVRRSDGAPDPILRATTGGVSQVLYARACQNVRVSASLIEELLGWMSSYRPVPKRFMARDQRTGGHARAAPPGGRAPGSLSPAPGMSHRGGLRGDRVSSHSFVVHNQRERILDAVTNLGASIGYLAITIGSITKHASVSADTFYSHFESKEDAFLVAYEIGQNRGFALTEAACRAAPDWPSGVRAGISAMFGFYASEPAFAHLALVDAQVVAPRTAARARKALDQYGQMFLHGADSPAQGSTALIKEAVIGGLFELCLSYTLERRTAELSSLVAPATYFALAPIIGSQAAARAARAPR